jgi:EamA domain-containing membrane protein RarD
MAVAPAVILALVAFLCWGLADFIAASAVKKSDHFKILFWSQMVTLFFFSGAFLFSYGGKVPQLRGRKSCS